LEDGGGEREKREKCGGGRWRKVVVNECLKMNENGGEVRSC